MWLIKILLCSLQDPQEGWAPESTAKLSPNTGLCWIAPHPQVSDPSCSLLGKET